MSEVRWVTWWGCGRLLDAVESTVEWAANNAFAVDLPGGAKTS